MKFKFIKSNDKEEVIIYAKEKNDFVLSIEEMCNASDSLLYGYSEWCIKKISPSNVECFFTVKDKVYALFEGEEYLIKKRLYELHQMYNEFFIFINQGCLANIYLIDHFDCSITSTLLVVFKSGHKDYASRRQIKYIKERLGIRK